MEELKHVVSIPFKKNLAVSLSEKDFEFSLAFDLKWFSPKTASKVKERALEVGLLSLKDGALIPGFDVDSVRLPHAFKPFENFLESQENSGKKSSSLKEEISFEQILEFISADTGVNRQRLVSEINSMQDRLSYLVDIRIVALVVARKFGCDIEAIFSKVARSVLGPFF
ncbi:DUF2240 family protein [Methanosarcina sp. Z-7115]|uniref:DUF2240 family protein n=1 Tax=Methanosarcina baikalica TaxID=3073890 RepID=A0ABU2D0V3_9EURY|nr:DUF2240 family protein [Methanosarcina sp. Z-7115]MDR7665615.1 DUF2240 family protein [Methanosarcina sp. Z-7115]